VPPPLPAPPPPTATTLILVTPQVGIKLYVPAVVYDVELGVTTGVTLLLAELAALVPAEFVAVTVNV
jgi:hypothetical protein